MSTFTLSNKGSVVYTDGTQSYSFLSSYNVFPHPSVRDAIVITPEISPVDYEAKGFQVKVSDVTQPSHTGRADLIQKLSEYFHKGGSSAGFFTLPEDHFFDTEAARDTALPNPVKGELSAIKQSGGTYIVQKYEPPAWVDQMALARGPEGEAPSIGPNGNWFIGTTDTGIQAAGSPLGLIDDTAPRTDRVYSSSKTANELVSNTKYFGANARLSYDADVNMFQFEEKTPSGLWQSQALVEADLLSDRIILQETHNGVQPQADRIILINRYVPVPKSYGSTEQVIRLRQFFLLPDGSELPLVAIYQDQLRIPQTDGTNEYAAFKSELKDNTKEFGDEARIRYSSDNKHIYIEIKKPDDTWEVKAEFGGSLIIDTVRYKESSGKPTVDLDEVGVFSKMVSVPDAYDSQQTHQELRAFFCFHDGEESFIPGVLNGQLRIPQTGDYSEYAAFKSEITPEKIIQAINQKLGGTNWQNSGSTPLPGTQFTAYYGFYHGETITELAAKSLDHKEISHPYTTFQSNQPNPPNFYYIIIPIDQATKVTAIAQEPSTLGGHWATQEISIKSIPYRAFRSPYRMYDTNPIFKIL